MDFSNMIAELPASERANAKIAIFTDKTVAKLPVMRVVEESLLKEGLNWVLWDKCAVEPTDKSWQVSQDHRSELGSRLIYRKRLIGLGAPTSLISWLWAEDPLWILRRLQTFTTRTRLPICTISSMPPLVKACRSLRSFLL